MASRSTLDRESAASIATDVLSQALIDDVRAGEREAFARYYELFRLPIYDLVCRLPHGRGDAAAVTQEAFLSAYRQILLQRGAIDLRLLTCRAAVSVCADHEGEAGSSDRLTEPAGDTARRTPPRTRSEKLAARFEQALAALTYDHRLALLLNDLHGLRRDQLATLLAVSEEAATALLFRARESFRRAFEEQSPDRRGAACRIAEQAAASAVGRGLADDELRKLREHAGYCRHCRATMSAWGDRHIGLALFLSGTPLPDSLLSVPVFGSTPAGAGSASGSGVSERTARIAGAAGPAGVFSGVRRALAGTRRAVASRATAYAVAAICLAASAGAITYVVQHDWTQIVRVREIVSAPAQTQPTPRRNRAPVVADQPVRDDTGASTASVALVSNQGTQPATTPAVYKVPATTVVVGDTPVAGSDGGAEPVDPGSGDDPDGRSADHPSAHPSKHPSKTHVSHASAKQHTDKQLAEEAVGRAHSGQKGSSHHSGGKQTGSSHHSASNGGKHQQKAGEANGSHTKKHE
jgi:DNA-directed RNA polymerase specialized sigma24 family protein